MKLLIETVSNGFILTVKDDDSHKLVFSQFNGTEESQIQTMVELLYSINDLIGPMTSRYSKERIRVITEPGDKYEPAQQGSFHSTGSRDESAERVDNTDRGSDS